MRDQLAHTDGVGFSKLTKRSEAGLARKLDQIGHLRDTLCELECGMREQKNVNNHQPETSENEQTSKHLIVAWGIPNAFTGSPGMEDRS